MYWPSINIGSSRKRFLKGKLKELCLKKGHRNTNFFHRMVNAYGRGNHIAMMGVIDLWLTEVSSLRRGFPVLARVNVVL